MQVATTAGLSIMELDEAFARIFASEDASKGGCPAVKGPAPSSERGCQSAFLQQQIARAAQACCPNPSHCPNGIPMACNDQCAMVVDAVAGQCGASMAQAPLNAPEPVVAALSQLMSLCNVGGGH